MLFLHILIQNFPIYWRSLAFWMINEDPPFIKIYCTQEYNWSHVQTHFFGYFVNNFFHFFEKLTVQSLEMPQTSSSVSVKVCVRSVLYIFRSNRVISVFGPQKSDLSNHVQLAKDQSSLIILYAYAEKTRMTFRLKLENATPLLKPYFTHKGLKSCCTYFFYHIVIRC